MCRSKPIDKEAITMFALPAGNDVEMGGGSYSEWPFSVNSVRTVLTNFPVRLRKYS